MALKTGGVGYKGSKFVSQNHSPGIRTYMVKAADKVPDMSDAAILELPHRFLPRALAREGRNIAEPAANASMPIVKTERPAR
jgi:hypothetical protein